MAVRASAPHESKDSVAQGNTSFVRRSLGTLDPKSVPPTPTPINRFAPGKGLAEAHLKKILLEGAWCALVESLDQHHRRVAVHVHCTIVHHHTLSPVKLLVYGAASATPQACVCSNAGASGTPQYGRSLSD